LERGTDINKTKKYGETPLYWTYLKHGNQPLIKYILEKGATGLNDQCKVRHETHESPFLGRVSVEISR